MNPEAEPAEAARDPWRMDDVIVAASSPPGRAARAAIRVSGSGALDVLRKIERTPAPRSRGIHRGRLHFSFGELPALVVASPGPASYTGEDSFELLVPGNPDLIEMMIAEMVAADARVRRAGPGEYSLRAFARGRLTLEQAEGVAASIAARTDAELRAAEHLRKGTLGLIAARLLEALADMLALVEAGIDFTDQEDVVAIAPSALCAGLRAALAEVTGILDSSIPMERLEAAPWVVLSGKPNAGKSALLNALLRQERAVVADQAGTTRDALAEPWKVPVPGGTLEVLLVDSPGLSDETTLLDQLGQEARARAIEHATLILRCQTVDEGNARGIVNAKAVGDASNSMPAAANEILVLTKCDLPHSIAIPAAVKTSAKNGTGLEELARAVGSALASSALSTAGEGMALAQRHRALLAACAGDLRQALDAAKADEAKRHLALPELVASAMHSAIEHLGGIAGRMAPDDILGRIFSRFCVGK